MVGKAVFVGHVIGAASVSWEPLEPAEYTVIGWTDIFTERK